MKMDRKGQNMIEYILLFAIVVVVLLIVLGKNGVITTSIDESLDTAVDGIETTLRKEVLEKKK